MRRGIVAAGNWIVDIVKTIDRFPAEGELCNILKVERSGGGGPCNVLFDLAALGAGIPLYAAGRLGDDEECRFLLEESRRRGIDVGCLRIDGGSSTSYTDVMSGHGRRTFFHCRGANAGLSPEDLLGIQVEARIFYLGYLLLLDGLDAPDPEYGTGAARVLSAMRERGFLTVVDFVSEAPEKFKRCVLASLPHVDVLAINEIEAGNTFDLAVRRPDGTLDLQAMAAASERFLRAGVKRMVIFHYPEGCWVQEAGSPGRTFGSIKVETDQIVGSNGAGDAFCAGVLYALHEGLPVERMVRYATVSARCNLMSASASGGAVSLQRMDGLIRRFFG